MAIAAAAVLYRRGYGYEARSALYRAFGGRHTDTEIWQMIQAARARAYGWPPD